MNKTAIKSIVMAGAFGGLVYAIIMSLFYQFFNDEVFNIKKFMVDFLMFAVIIAGVTWYNLRKKNQTK